MTALGQDISLIGKSEAEAAGGHSSISDARVRAVSVLTLVGLGMFPIGGADPETGSQRRQFSTDNCPSHSCELKVAGQGWIMDASPAKAFAPAGEVIPYPRLGAPLKKVLTCEEARTALALES